LEKKNAWMQLRTGLGWLTRILVALAILSALLLPLLLMTMPDMEEISLQVPVEAGTAWLVLVATLFWLVLLYIVWRLIRGLLLYPLGSWRVFGTTTGARIVALGITALIVPKAVTALVMAPLTFLLQLIERMPRLAMRIVMSNTGSSGKSATYSIKEPLIQLSISIQDMVVELGKAFGKAIEGILIPEVVVGLAIWAALGNLFSATVAEDGTGAASARNRLLGYIQSLSTAQRYGIVLTAVFLFGAYLSIAAIVAIPWLHEDRVAPALSRENLEKMLTGILPQSPEHLDEHLRNIPVVNVNPLAPLNDYLAKRSKSTSMSDIYLLSALQQAIADSEDARARAINQARSMPAEIVRRAAEMRRAALSAFDLETASPMSVQERGHFVREIQRSVSSDFGLLERTLRSCVTAIGESEKRLREVAHGAQLLPIAAAPPNAQGDNREQELIQLTILARQLTSASLSLRDACEAPLVLNSVYTPPAPGSTWGPFGLVARWLLQTKSFALTLITGMLGFGLLGSVISTFVRGGAARAQTSLTSEVVSVLVRGLSAAVVVFLAVKGGLAAFSSGDSEPNAYVVFFTCLIGAVFSEDVWKWAHSKFLDNLNSRPEPREKEQTMADTMDRQADDDGMGQKDKGDG